MKKIIFTFVFLFIVDIAKAQTQVYTAVSSATWCNISISTLQPTRVDNFNGSCEGAMLGRTTLRIVNGAGTLHGGYSIYLSTISTNSKYGETINPYEVHELDLTSTMTYYLQSEPAISSPTAIIQQARQNFAR